MGAGYTPAQNSRSRKHFLYPKNSLIEGFFFVTAISAHATAHIIEDHNHPQIHLLSDRPSIPRQRKIINEFSVCWSSLGVVSYPFQLRVAALNHVFSSLSRLLLNNTAYVIVFVIYNLKRELSAC